jgi:hypothetical protein
MKIELQWVARKDNAEFYLKCGSAICARLIIVSADEALGDTLVLWGADSSDLVAGYEHEYDDTFASVKASVEKDIKQFFLDCFGKDTLFKIIDDDLLTVFHEEYGSDV